MRRIVLFCALFLGCGDSNNNQDMSTQDLSAAMDMTASTGDMAQSTADMTSGGQQFSTDKNNPVTITTGTVNGTVSASAGDGGHFFVFTPSTSGPYTLNLTGTNVYVNFDRQKGTLFCGLGLSCCQNTCQIMINDQQSDGGAGTVVPGIPYYINVIFSQQSGSASYTLTLTGP
jgi:hypothetical protein